MGAKKRGVSDMKMLGTDSRFIYSIRYILGGAAVFHMLIGPSVANACLEPPASWGWSDERLVQCSSTIATGIYDGKGFKVSEVLRGKVPNGSWTLKVHSENNNTDLSNEIGINPDCSLSTKFEKGQTYLVFHHSHHPKGYLKINGTKDLWLLKIRSLSKTVPKGKDCEPITDEKF